LTASTQDESHFYKKYGKSRRRNPEIQDFSLFFCHFHHFFQIDRQKPYGEVVIGIIKIGR